MTLAEPCLSFYYPKQKFCGTKHQTKLKKKKKKRKNLVRNNLKGKSYEIKTQRTSMGKSFKKKKSLITLLESQEVAPYPQMKIKINTWKQKGKRDWCT